MIRSEFAPSVLRAEALPDGLAFEFASEMRTQVEALVALERECCSGLDWRVVGVPGGDGVRLEVHGIEPRSAGSLLTALGREAR
jgi:hypothetical protein